MEQNLIMPRLKKPTARVYKGKVTIWKGPGAKGKAKHSYSPSLVWNGKTIRIDRGRMKPTQIGRFGSDGKITVKPEKIYIGRVSDRTKQIQFKPKQRPGKKFLKQ